MISVDLMTDMRLLGSGNISDAIILISMRLNWPSPSRASTDICKSRVPVDELESFVISWMTYKISIIVRQRGLQVVGIAIVLGT